MIKESIGEEKQTLGSSPKLHIPLKFDRRPLTVEQKIDILSADNVLVPIMIDHGNRFIGSEFYDSSASPGQDVTQ